MAGWRKSRFASQLFSLHGGTVTHNRPTHYMARARVGSPSQKEKNNRCQGEKGISHTTTRNCYPAK